jgi:hypothetical protein
MSAFVDYDYYATVYVGSEADEASFPALCARAEDVVGAMTRWAVTADNFSTYPQLIQTLYKKAVCAQVDYFAVNGTETATGDSTDGGWTVGRVSVTGKANTGAGAGKLSAAVSPLAIAYLEQTGLMNPQVPTAHEPAGWWF